MMQILRARDRAATPWKNGGGTTREVAVFPPGAGLGDFGWRVSIAKVERGGPFSVFPGIDRTIALFEGRMALTVAGRGIIELAKDTAPFAFPGDVATDARIIDGPVIDLNVMTRRGAFAARMTRARGLLTFDSTATTFLFPLSRMQAAGEFLTAGDAILMTPGAGIALSPDADFYRIEILPAA